MVPVYMFSAMRSRIGRPTHLCFTLLAFFSFLPAIAQRPDIRYTLKSDVFRIAIAAAADCKRSFEELKEKF
jgi:hypothetical protein